MAYSLHGELTFDAGDAASKSSIYSPAVHLKYLPIVPTSIPHFPVIEMAQVQDPYTGQTLFKATLQSPQRGLCPGAFMFSVCSRLANLAQFPRPSSLLSWQ